MDPRLIPLMAANKENVVTANRKEKKDKLKSQSESEKQTKSRQSNSKKSSNAKVLWTKKPLDISKSKTPKSEDDELSWCTLSPSRKFSSVACFDEENPKKKLLKLVGEGKFDNEKEVLEDKRKPMKKTVYPFNFDRHCITFVGRIGDEPVTSYLSIKNNTKWTYMFKIKCSNNSLFKIRPIIGLIEPTSEAEITIIYGGTHAQPLFQEFITVHSMTPDPLCPNLAKAFKRKAHYEGRHKIYVDFAYHEDPDQVLGGEDRRDFIYEIYKAFMKREIKKTAIERIVGEKKERENAKLTVKTPERELTTRKLGILNYYKSLKQENPWMKDVKLKGCAPKVDFKFE